MPHQGDLQGFRHTAALTPWDGSEGAGRVRSGTELPASILPVPVVSINPPNISNIHRDERLLLSKHRDAYLYSAALLIDAHDRTFKPFERSPKNDDAWSLRCGVLAHTHHRFLPTTSTPSVYTEGARAMG